MSNKKVDVLLLAQKVARIGTWEVDITKGTCHWSDITYEIHEVPLGTPIKVEEGINYYTPEHQPIIQACVDKGIESGEPWDVELQIQTPTGKTKWTRAIGQAVKKNGELIRLEGIFQDIDERKTTELNYNELYERFKLATQASEIGIWDWDIPNNNLKWDDKMFDVYGVSKDKFSSAYEAWEKGIHPEDIEQSNKDVQAALKGQSVFDSQFRAITDTGEIRHIKAYSTVIRNDDGNPIRMIGTNFDITKSYLAEQNLIKLNEELVQFAYRTSHDLKSPLLSMKSIVALAIESIQNNDYSLLGKDLKLIDNLINKLTTLIKDMMDLTKIDHLESTIESFNLENEIMDIFEEYQFDLEKYQIDTDIVNSLDDTFKTDPIRLRHILNNLISNSIKYHDPEKTNKEIIVNAHATDSMSIIEIIDNGLGIPKDQQENVFKMFKRFNQTKEGTGLGLYMVKKNVEMIKGTISFKSSPEKTIFTIKIPRKVD